MVQLRVHHYETRCALRLACKRFAEHISIFDKRALPIVSNTSYRHSQTDGGLKWKGIFTYSSRSRIGDYYLKFCFRRSLRFCVYELDINREIEKLEFVPSQRIAYLRFYSGHDKGVIGKIIRTITKKVCGAWHLDLKDALFATQDNTHGLTKYDLIVIDQFRAGEPQDDGRIDDIYMEYSDYRAMIQELECIRRLRDEFPGFIRNPTLDEEYQSAQKRRRLTE